MIGSKPSFGAAFMMHESRRFATGEQMTINMILSAAADVMLARVLRWVWR